MDASLQHNPKDRYNYVANWRLKTKITLIIYKGGRCEKCGYDKLNYPRAFHFHHINPNEKDFGISSANRSLDKLKIEVDKCQLLCCRCHAELHDEIDNDKRAQRVFAVKTKIAEINCKICCKKFKPTDRKVKCCSKECASIFRRKVERPTVEHLLKMKESMSWTEIAKIFGVSDNAVRKWIRNQGCPELAKEQPDKL